jgi:UDP-arabinose 4-epimerase
MNILVTGGAGYIGSHTCKALAKAGFIPITYDNLVTGHEWAVRWGPLVRGEMLDRSRLDEVMREYQPSAVLHFAAYSSVEESVKQPLKYYMNNVVGTINLLVSMQNNRVQDIVFSSTCATYGNPQTVPLAEIHPQNPINPYGASKLMVERILSDLGDAGDLRSASLRYFNAAGADPEGEIGEDHDNETRLIPLVLAAAKGIIPHITIYGKDYATEDGTCIRDYVHVSDLADAHVLALKALKEQAGSRSYNLGSGKGFSVREVIQAARTVTGLSIPVVEGPRRPGDPPRLVADAKRARTELGWQVRYADLTKIIATTWNWMLKHQPEFFVQGSL